MGGGLGTSVLDRSSGRRCHGNSGVVDDPVHDHVNDRWLDRAMVGRDACDSPCELFITRQKFVRAAHPDRVGVHEARRAPLDSIHFLTEPPTWAAAAGGT